VFGSLAYGLALTLARNHALTTNPATAGQINTNGTGETADYADEHGLDWEGGRLGCWSLRLAPTNFSQI